MDELKRNPNEENTPESSEITRLLAEIQGGRREATDRLLPLVYAELRRMARGRLGRERPGQTLQPTALVHEAYLRLVDTKRLPWENRAHFFGAAAEAMRRIMVERARRLARQKRGGGRRRVTLDPNTPGDDPDSLGFLALNQALSRLEAKDPQMAQIVKLRYFAGLTVRETAACSGVSARSVNRSWTAARAWLLREIAQKS